MQKIKKFIKRHLLTIILSVIPSIAITYFFTIWQMERTIISYEISQPLDIGKGLSSIFPSFELQHNGEIINDGVVQYIHGRFKNESKYKDVKTTTSNCQLELILPDSCQIMEVYVPQEYEFKVDATKDSNKIIFLFPETLKPKEEFEFSAIFNNHNEIEPKFELSTRIQDTSLHKKKEVIHSFKSIVFLVVILLFFFWILALIVNIKINRKMIKQSQEIAEIQKKEIEEMYHSFHEQIMNLHYETPNPDETTIDSTK